MSRRGIDWFAGDGFAQSEIESAFDRGLDEATRIQSNRHRTVHRIAAENSSRDAQPSAGFILKTHHVATGRHPLREALKRRLGSSPARREWLALQSLLVKSVYVPRPRAWGRLEDGDEILVTEELSGTSARDSFRAATPEERPALADALGRTLQTLYQAGYRHGDLHLGNLFVTDDRIVLLDLQKARPLKNSNERLHDLATLELSLARAGWSLDERSAFRAPLEPTAHFESALRRFLQDHVRGRARRRHRVGRDWAAAEFDGLRGLREQSLSLDSLREIIQSADRNPSPRQRRNGRIHLTEANTGDRVVVVKRVESRGLRRALGDQIRGTSGKRAFHKGQRASLLGDRAARPLAYVEERRLGLALRSWLVIERVGEIDLDCITPESPELARRIALALGAWLAEAHSWGLSHRDLKAGNVRVTIRDTSIDFWLIDLEDLTGPTNLTDDARRHSLSQLNASLSDEAFGLDARREALEAYLAHVPFKAEKSDAAGIAAQIARQSLARGHRWRGIGCDLSRHRQDDQDE